jgi:hypothetical protein
MRLRLALCWKSAAAFGGLLSAGSACGCGLVLDSGKYHAVEADAQSSAGTSIDAHTSTPDADASATACSPGQDRRSLENGCSNSACVPFSGTVPDCNGSLCPLPTPTALADGGTTSGDAGDAGIACTTVRPNPNDIVFVTGSTALKGFIQEVSKVLATQPQNPVTVVYQASGSCFGVKAAIDPGNNPLAQSAGTSTYYDGSGNAQTCVMDPTRGIAADIGASDVFYSTCFIGQMVTPALPQDITDNFGPVQVMNFADAPTFRPTEHQLERGVLCIRIRRERLSGAALDGPDAIAYS